MSDPQGAIQHKVAAGWTYEVKRRNGLAPPDTNKASRPRAHSRKQKRKYEGWRWIPTGARLSR
jgi:hypothetical protein